MFVPLCGSIAGTSYAYQCGGMERDEGGTNTQARRLLGLPWRRSKDDLLSLLGWNKGD